MGRSYKFYIVALIPAVAVLLFSFLRQQPPTPIATPAAVGVAVNETKSPASPNAGTATNRPAIRPQSGIRRRFSDFSDAEKAKFLADFAKRYQPAVAKWCKTYEGRVPFSPEEVTPDKLAERFSKNPSAFAEYAFVVNGVTLGIRDANGTASVDYLNDPQQTKKLAMLPTKYETPITGLPLTRDEVSKLLETETGSPFSPYEIRMKPSGFSGSLNGGVLVHVGGDPDNGASWKYDMIFGADGKLAFYLKGHGQL